MTKEEMVKFCKDFVSLLDRPVKTATARDMINVVERNKSFAIEYSLTEDFLMDDEYIKKLYNNDYVYCKVYAFIRDNQRLFEV